MNPPDDIKRWLSYNRDTGLFRWLRTYYKCRAGDVAGHRSKKGYVQIRFGGVLYYAHRLAWWFEHGAMPPKVDHKNLTRHDNRIDNLRAATTSQNMANSLAHAGRKFKGVYFRARQGKWQAAIRRNGKFSHLGYFNSDVEAAKAYDTAAVEQFGEFARTNL